MKNLLPYCKKNLIEAGCDEAGRGCLSGPVVAGAVILDPNKAIKGLDDSKKLTEKKRNYIYEIINNTEISYSISVCDNKQIDMYGIQKSNQAVLINSINKVKTGGEKIYIDHFKVDIPESESLTRGEDKSISIALASIIAKVSRDNYMIELSEKFPEYDFASNKGYGTLKHREAIKKYGLTKFHRRSFNLMPK